jgi:alginate O-acetyltransferase complex protein AlgI
MSVENTTIGILNERSEISTRRWSLVAVWAMLAVFAFVTPRLVPGWGSTLLNCFALIFVLKHSVWLASKNVINSATFADRVKFYLLWIGFDLPAFLDRTASPPSAAAWFAAAGRTAASAGLVWGVNRWLPYDRWPLEFGIFGMGTCVLFVLFGLFHRLALAWQAAGRNVRPIMNAPWKADSLADFWGRRWNLAFRDSAALVIFRPIARRWGVAAATVAVFFASGILHEVVITLPARGGYGWPTLYFMLQCAALILQRRFDRIDPNDWNVFSRITTLLVVFVPLPLLFPTPFCTNVVIPFLRMLGAL